MNDPREHPGADKLSAGGLGREDAALNCWNADDLPLYLRLTRDGAGSRRAELENAVSVGSSTREVKKSRYLEAVPSTGAPGAAAPSVFVDGWAGFGGAVYVVQKCLPQRGQTQN